MVFLPLFFSPCEDVGRHPPKSNSCVPPALVICVWCDGVLTVLLTYGIVWCAHQHLISAMGQSYVVTVAFVQLCEEMLEREGMERKGKCGFWEAFVHFTSMLPPRRLNLQL